ncbi:MAG: 3-phosphoshikimate 1-carboxyvinyltransferase [Bacteroidaceae bacterium]|nr:3-phosphoshikimate 1-carboxyvinyltransferase [Bacteroidaceae bacterium]
MSHLLTFPHKEITGKIALPASKSISNRALLINALAGNKELPQNLSDSDDTRVMLRALQDMPDTIDIGAAGTAMRFMTAYLSVTPGEHVITGTERMRQRPIAILVDALRQLGANITYEAQEGFPPLRIVGNDKLDGGELTVPGDVSSQYISALLMIAPTLHKGLRLTLSGNIASKPYLEMTLSMMREFGAKAEWTKENVIEVLPSPYEQHNYHIESDWSAASYWYEIVALSASEDSQIDLVGLHSESIQGDSKVKQLFNELGVETQYFVEPDGTEITRLRKSGNITSPFNYDFTHQPDLAQTFVVTCSMLNIPFRFTGLHSLKIKETDRITALRTELRKLGYDIQEQDNSILFWNGERCQPEETPAIDTYQDHRMAMAFAPCVLKLNTLCINNPEVVSKSYPRFWEDFSIICSISSL